MQECGKKGLLIVQSGRCPWGGSFRLTYGGTPGPTSPSPPPPWGRGSCCGKPPRLDRSKSKSCCLRSATLIWGLWGGGGGRLPEGLWGACVMCMPDGEREINLRRVIFAFYFFSPTYPIDWLLFVPALSADAEVVVPKSCRERLEKVPSSSVQNGNVLR